MCPNILDGDTLAGDAGLVTTQGRGWADKG